MVVQLTELNALTELACALFHCRTAHQCLGRKCASLCHPFTLLNVFVP
jgi:hypothetical protein